MTRPSSAAIGTPPSVSMNQVKIPSNDHSDQAAEQQPAQSVKPTCAAIAVEAGAMSQRQHPGDAAVVDPRLGGEENADHDHRDHAGRRADRGSDSAGQAAD